MEAMFGLTAQLRRAAVSIASNIVEGCARHWENEYVRFLNIGYGSSREVEYRIELSHRLGFLLRNFRPGGALYLAATVVFDFGHSTDSKAATPVRCRLVNTHDPDERGGGLAYNVTAAIEKNLENDYTLKSDLRGLLRPDKRTHDVGLFGITPYRPQMIPVVFVHGLSSDPSIWKNAFNEIAADPDLARTYVPLVFLYPTGMGVPQSAARLRDSLHKNRETWDPGHDSPGFRKMVIVGHSMGGLLSRLQVIVSGDEFWRAFFTEPVSEIPGLSETDRQNIESSLDFECNECIRRAVFISVPHRGSKIADNGLVRLATRLIRLPTSGTAYAIRAISRPDLLNTTLFHYHSLGLNGVEMLSPEHPYFAAMEKLPIGVPYHTILGDRGRNDSSNSFDGVVPYRSSHLDGADSEKVVPFGHSCTAEYDTVNELLRILRLHAEQS